MILLMNLLSDKHHIVAHSKPPHRQKGGIHGDTGELKYQNLTWFSTRNSLLKMSVCTEAKAASPNCINITITVTNTVV